MASFLGNSFRRSVRVNGNSLTKVGQQSRNFSAKNLRPGGWPGPNPYFYVVGCTLVGLVGGYYWKQWQMEDRAYSMAFDKWYKMVKQAEDRELIEKAFEADDDFKNMEPSERAATVYKVKQLLEVLPEEFKASPRYQSIYKLWQPYFPDADLFKPEGEDEEEEESTEEETADEEPEVVPEVHKQPPQQPTPARDAAIDDSKLRTSEDSKGQHQDIAHVSKIDTEPIVVQKPATTEKP